MSNNDDARLLNSAILRETFYKINGSFEPTKYEAENINRKTNLITALKFMDGLLIDVIKVAPYRMHSKYSMKHIGEQAHERLLEWKELLDEYARIHD